MIFWFMENYVSMCLLFISLTKLLMLWKHVSIFMQKESYVTQKTKPIKSHKGRQLDCKFKSPLFNNLHTH